MQNPFTTSKRREQELLDSELVGYDDLKDFLSKLMADPTKSMNVLFLGSPSTAKTRILDYVAARFKAKDVIQIYHNVETSTGRGIIWSLIEKLIENKKKQIKLLGKFFPEKPKEVWLFLDEIDKIKVISELNQLLTLLEGRKINYKRFRKTYEVDHIKLKVFATTNTTELLPKPFLNRFFVFKLGKYSKDQLITIAKALSIQYIKSIKNKEERESIAEEIVNVLWDLRKRTVRKAIQVMDMYDLYKQEKTIKEIFEFTQKYNSTEEDEDEEEEDYSTDEVNEDENEEGKIERL